MVAFLERDIRPDERTDEFEGNMAIGKEDAEFKP